ncbi:MAG: FkbM family methyltransferase [Actinomycetota bacterium]|nr:FkbM family methyltransferase [Actinomycetota bacterium]MDQ3897247.1 FkbM family methyltransferase [Actinomycetota bacterium]
MSTTVQLRDGRAFYVSAEDYLEWYLLFFGAYEPEITRLLAHLTTETSTVVDVGANIGVHSLTMSALASKGRVLAFEPHPTTVERLRANLTLNGATNVEALPFAVLDHACVVELHDNTEKHRGMASLHPYEGWSKVTVEGTTLDAAIDAHRVGAVDVIKVDVEGYEAPVLAGGLATLARDKPAVIFEYVQWAWENCGYDLESTLRQLRDIGYDGFHLIERAGLVRLPEPFHGSGNILALGPGRGGASWSHREER